VNARALFAAIAALFLAGCASPTPTKPPVVTAKIAYCAELAPSTGLDLAWRYIASSYPEQSIATLDLQHWNERYDSTGTGPVIVKNTATGFRWEGRVEAYTERTGVCVNPVTYQRIVEMSVVLPTPGILTPTPTPASTATTTRLVPPTVLATRTP